MCVCGEGVCRGFPVDIIDNDVTQIIIMFIGLCNLKMYKTKYD